jgi:hypothetical protein
MAGRLLIQLIINRPNENALGNELKVELTKKKGNYSNFSYNFGNFLRSWKSQTMYSCRVGQ